MCPVVSSPEESAPKGDEGVGVKGTDEYEQQKVETHHDRKMVSREPGGAAGMSDKKHKVSQAEESALYHTII